MATADTHTLMNSFLLNNNKVSRVAFGTTLDRELLPLKTPHTRAGNEMGLRGVPNLGPGSYDNDEVSTFVHSMELKPVCKRGYSLGARTGQRFRDLDAEVPGPPSYQKIISKPREFLPAKKPFQSGATRFPRLKQALTPGAGSYEHDTARNRKVQFHGSFGGAQSLRCPVRIICKNGVQDTCVKCQSVPSGDYYLNKKEEALCRPCYAELSIEASEKEARKFLSKFQKVRDCCDIHQHEGTNAKLRLMSDKDLKKLKHREAYLSLYYD